MGQEYVGGAGLYAKSSDCGVVVTVTDETVLHAESCFSELWRRTQWVVKKFARGMEWFQVAFFAGFGLYVLLWCPETLINEMGLDKRTLIAIVLILLAAVKIPRRQKTTTS